MLTEKELHGVLTAVGNRLQQINHGFLHEHGLVGVQEPEAPTQQFDPNPHAVPTFPQLPVGPPQ